MRSTTIRGPISVVACAGLAAAALAIGLPGRGAARMSAAPIPAPAPAPAPQDAPKPAGPTEQYVGVEYCRNCHVNPTGRNTELALLREAAIWYHDDKHSQAFAVLKPENPRAKRMGDLLGYDVTKADACLSCHAPAYHAPIEDADARTALLGEGVSCVACHGAYREWIQDHQGGFNPGWRKIDATVKESKFGMADLRDPVRRGELCLSCHVGNADEKKVVTHEMYAAGHPPLPSIEVAAFSLLQPPHWREPKDVPFLQNADAETRAKYHYTEGESTPAKIGVYGGVVALREAMNLLGAEMKARQDDPENRWPDLARYDCYACHHDLKVAGWRPRRGFPGTPGRVPLPEWPEALVGLAVKVGSPDPAQAKSALDEYARLVKELHAAVDAQQYGDPSRVAAAAAALANWSTDQIKRLNDVKGTPFSRESSLAILRDITRLASEGTPDYESSRQYAWTFWSIYEGLDPKPENDSAIREALDGLDRAMHLNLPADGAYIPDPKPDATPAAGPPIEATLADRLKVMSDYDPEAVQALFATLSGLLPKD